MKSRGCYETPRRNHPAQGASGHGVADPDREVAHLKDDLMPRYASLVYNGYWWSPERKLLQTLIDASQAPVERRGAGQAAQGQCDCCRVAQSDDSLSDDEHRHVLRTTPALHNQKDAEGFHQAERALRMRIGGAVRAVSWSCSACLFLSRAGFMDIRDPIGPVVARGSPSGESRIHSLLGRI